MFLFFFKGISEIYANKSKHYQNFLPKIDFEERFQQIPTRLYKYIDLDGGITSINNRTIRFSDPLSFWGHETLGDKTEFWFDRIYIDHISLQQMYVIISAKSPRHRCFDEKDVFLYLLHHQILNLTKRNKVLCLAKTFENQELWNDYSQGICIEYNTDLFIKNRPIFPNSETFSLIGRPILYVDNLVKYPIRTTDDFWLSNLIFVKNKNPFIREDEYRILYTDEDYDSVKEIPRRKDRLEQVIKLLLNGEVRETPPLDAHIDTKYIVKVYYKNSVKDEKRLLNTLQKFNIPVEKLD